MSNEEKRNESDGLHSRGFRGFEPESDDRYIESSFEFLGTFCRHVTFQNCSMFLSPCRMNSNRDGIQDEAAETTPPVDSAIQVKGNNGTAILSASRKVSVSKSPCWTILVFCAFEFRDSPQDLSVSTLLGQRICRGTRKAAHNQLSSLVEMKVGSLRDVVVTL
jgi:hypothetical protein